MNDQNQQPNPHRKRPAAQDVRVTVDRRQLLRGAGMLTGLALLLGIALTPGTAVSPAPEPESRQARTGEATVISADAQVLQRMTYARCGHHLLRRQTLPQELTGGSLNTVSAAYADWQITVFQPDAVQMERSLNMFCPDHMVLMPDEGGMLCEFQNRYGDALALVKELQQPVGDLPDSLQEQLRPGKAFDDLPSLEKWLEGADS